MTPARRLEGERLPWAAALARLLRASETAGHGDKPRAREQSMDAASALTVSDMRLYAAVTRRRAGELAGGEEGRALVEKADAFMTGQMVRNPDRFAALTIPLSTRSAT
jgi:MoxR-like ATPase